MSTVVVRRAATSAPSSGAAARAVGSHPKMKIIASGKAFTVPYAPRETTSTGFVPEWSTVVRPGREPLLLRAGGSLETVTFDLIVAYPEPSQSVATPLNQLAVIAASGTRIRLNFDARASRHLWRMTSHSEQVIARQHGTNQPTRAVVSMTFTEVSDSVRAVGPASGGTAEVTYTDKTRPKTYRWKKGDSMHKVAKRFYGTAALWDALSDYNRISRTRRLVPGRIIKLPRKALLLPGPSGQISGGQQSSGGGSPAPVGTPIGGIGPVSST